MFGEGHELSSRDGIVVVVAGACELVSDACDGVDGMVVDSDGTRFLVVGAGVWVFVVLLRDIAILL